MYCNCMCNSCKLEITIMFISGNKNVQLKALKTVEAVASFKNPLNKPLTDVTFFIEGTGLLTATSIKSGYVSSINTLTNKQFTSLCIYMYG